MGRRKLRPRRAVVLPQPATPKLPSVRELAEEVEIFRRAQQVWARTRTAEAGARVRRLESELDQRVATILATREPPPQPAPVALED